jgi:hypothetical protein
MPADSPIPLAIGPLTSLAPALSGFTTESSSQECFYTNNLAYTGEEKPRHKVRAKQVRQGCP